MALIKCKECGKEIAKKAKTYPHCGIENKPSPGEVAGGLIVMIVFFVIIVVVVRACSGGDDAAETAQKSAATENKMAKEEYLKSLVGEEEYNRQMAEFNAEVEQLRLFNNFCKFMKAPNISPRVTLCGAWGDNFHMLVMFEPSQGSDVAQGTVYCQTVANEMAKKFSVMKGAILQIKTPRSPEQAVVTCTIGE